VLDVRTPLVARPARSARRRKDSSTWAAVLAPGLHPRRELLRAGGRARGPDIEHGDVGRCLSSAGRISGSAPATATTFVPCRGEQQDEPLPEQGVVLGDHHTHGNSASDHGRAPTGLVTAKVRRARNRRRMPDSPVPPVRHRKARPALAVVAYDHPHPGGRCGLVRPRLPELAVPGRVGQRLGHGRSRRPLPPQPGRGGPFVEVIACTMTSIPRLRREPRRTRQPRSVRIGG